MSRSDVTQIRPLLYIGERRSARLAESLQLPVVKSTCPMDRTSKRREVKALLPGATEPGFTAEVSGYGCQREAASACIVTV